MPGTPQRHTHDYRHHAAANLFAALDAAAGKVITSMTPRPTTRAKTPQTLHMAQYRTPDTRQPRLIYPTKSPNRTLAGCDPRMLWTF